MTETSFEMPKRKADESESEIEASDSGSVSDAPKEKKTKKTKVVKEKVVKPKVRCKLQHHCHYGSVSRLDSNACRLISRVAERKSESDERKGQGRSRGRVCNSWRYSSHYCAQVQRRAAFSLTYRLEALMDVLYRQHAHRYSRGA